jgi:hypothetical protein
MVSATTPWTRLVNGTPIAAHECARDGHVEVLGLIPAFHLHPNLIQLRKPCWRKATGTHQALGYVQAFSQKHQGGLKTAPR